MALVLTTDSIRLVHSLDPAVTVPKDRQGREEWLPETMCTPCDGATVIEVRGLTGIEFARAAAIDDRAEEMGYVLATGVVSVDGNKSASVEGWPYTYARDARVVVIHMSAGGALPLDLPQPPASTDTD